MSKQAGELYLTDADLERAYPLLSGQVEPWTEVLLSEGAHHAVHVADKDGLQVCRSLGRQVRVFEKIFMGAFSKVTCGHCKRYVSSGSKTALMIPEGGSGE